MKVWRCPSPHLEPVRYPWLHSTGAQHPQQPRGDIIDWNQHRDGALPGLVLLRPAPLSLLCPSLLLPGTGSLQSARMQSQRCGFEASSCAQGACSPAVTWHENTHFKEIFHTLGMFSEHQLSNPTARDSGQLAGPEGCFVP